MTATPRPDPLIGALVGNYRIRERLGRGGMGAVYAAEHPIIGKRVAIKVLHPDHACNHNVVSRFFAEGRAINEIQHPNIVDILDFGTIANDGSGQATAYLVMEYLEGRTLRSVIREEAPLELARTVDICCQIAAALEASHRKQIIHRDLKPDNVMLVERDGRADYVKVLDFGVAKLAGDQIETGHHTHTGMIVGTPKYMSPEQCEGMGHIDHRTDIYSLGILLYAMLTRALPFTGDGYGQLVVQHLTVAPTPPSELAAGIPAHIESACLRALAKIPDERHPSMREFASALGGPLDPWQPAGGDTSPVFEASELSQLESLHSSADLSDLSLPPAAPAPQSPRATRRRRYAWMIAGGAGTLAVASLLLLVGGGDARPSSESTEAIATAPAAAPPDAGTSRALERADADRKAAAPDAAPQVVDIVVRSEPSAALFVDGVEAGRTPHTLTVERGAGDLELRLEAPGHRPLEETIAADTSREIDVSLSRLPRRPPPRATRDEPAAPPSTEPAGDEDGTRTLNPFEKYRRDSQ